MEVRDLKTGMVVESRNGVKRTVYKGTPHGDIIAQAGKECWTPLYGGGYEHDLMHNEVGESEWDI